jgi:hypothetical protein
LDNSKYSNIYNYCRISPKRPSFNIKINDENKAESNYILNSIKKKKRENSTILGKNHNKNKSNKDKNGINILYNKCSKAKNKTIQINYKKNLINKLLNSFFQMDNHFYFNWVYFNYIFKKLSHFFCLRKKKRDILSSKKLEIKF